MIVHPTELKSGFSIEGVAKICHEANRAYCEMIGDFSQVPWDQAPDWQKSSAAKSVEFRLANPKAPISAQHEEWCKAKMADGWVYGPEKNAEAKTHPCLVSYRDLPPSQREKDDLFVAIVNALREEEIVL